MIELGQATSVLSAIIATWRDAAQIYFIGSTHDKPQLPPELNWCREHARRKRTVVGSIPTGVMRQISRESNPGHADDNDVFRHWTTDASVERFQHLLPTRYVKMTV